MGFRRISEASTVSTHGFRLSLEALVFPTFKSLQREFQSFRDDGSFFKTWVFPKIRVPQNGWFIMENLIKMDDLGVPPFLETSTCIFLIFG